MNILMVDDDEVTNFLMDILLSKTPFVGEYNILTSGKEALKFLSDYKSHLTCIIVDVKMPVMDGFQFVEHYEQHFREKFPETKVYFLTSSARQSDKARAMEFISVMDTQWQEWNLADRKEGSLRLILVKNPTPLS